MSLHEARSTARARAVEDFDYFVHAVLGRRRISSEVCRRIQKQVERGFTPRPPDLMTKRALELWLCVLDEKTTTTPPTETYAWLFGEAA